MRILVIEDDNDTAAYLAKGLKETGYTVDRAADGREGLFLATSEQYDAMIVDRMLPAWTGWRSCSRCAPRTTPRLS
jgi:two-component system OmpR family response regulator